MMRLWLGLFCLSSVFGQTSPFHYALSVTDPKTDVARATLTVPSLSENTVTFAMPAWAPGSYRIVNYGRWIDSVQAFDKSGASLAVIQKTVNEWQIRNAKSLARITYLIRDIPEDSLPSLPSSLNEMTKDYWFFNGPSVFGYLKNVKDRPYNVDFHVPCGWRIWCGMPTEDGFFYSARSYDELIDNPVLAGTADITEYTFQQDGARYVMAVNADTDVKMDTLIALAKPIIAYETRLFGETPFSGYYFLFNFFTSGSRFGALEHANSSAYYLPPPSSQRGLRGSFYPRVIAHELFHLWNPKRIRPKELKNFDYQKPVKITSMWFIEGVTEYYAKLTMMRSGVSPKRTFYNELKEIAQSDLRENLEAQSLDAAQTGVTMEMYTKGALVAFLMDIEIRDQTNNKLSLDSVVVRLNRKKEYDDKKLIPAIKSLTGVDLKSFYKKYIAGKEALPMRDYCEKAGLSYEIAYPPHNGWYWDINDKGQLVVNSVGTKSTASSLGLKAADIVTDILGQSLPKDVDGVRVILDKVEALKVGDALMLKVLRGGQTLELKSAVIAGEQAYVTLKENPNCTDKQKAIRDGITGN